MLTAVKYFFYEAESKIERIVLAVAVLLLIAVCVICPLDAGFGVKGAVITMLIGIALSESLVQVMLNR